jgi:hypothetical protein
MVVIGRSERIWALFRHGSRISLRDSGMTALCMSAIFHLGLLRVSSQNHFMRHAV